MNSPPARGSKDPSCLPSTFRKWTAWGPSSTEAPPTAAHVAANHSPQTYAMSFFDLFRKTAPLPVDVEPEVPVETMELDFQNTLSERWGTFVTTFVSLYGMPLLVQSQGPGRTTGFAALNEDSDDQQQQDPNPDAKDDVSRLTDVDVLRELGEEWNTQLHIAASRKSSSSRSVLSAAKSNRFCSSQIT